MCACMSREVGGGGGWGVEGVEGSHVLIGLPVSDPVTGRTSENSTDLDSPLGNSQTKLW